MKSKPSIKLYTFFPPEFYFWEEKLNPVVWTKWYKFFSIFLKDDRFAPERPDFKKYVKYDDIKIRWHNLYVNTSLTFGHNHINRVRRLDAKVDACIRVTGLFNIRLRFISNYKTVRLILDKGKEKDLIDFFNYYDFFVPED